MLTESTARPRSRHLHPREMSRCLRVVQGRALAIRYVKRDALPSHAYLTLFLSALPSVDAILNQVNTVFQPNIGPFSLLQAFRGLILLIVFIFLLSQAHRIDVSVPGLVAAGIFVLLNLTIFAVKEYCSTGSLAMVSAVAYGQMAYWIVMWLPVAMVCTSPANSRRLLWGLVAGCAIIAASIYIGYFSGNGNFYGRDSVASSAGWFNTAKGSAGVLLVGVFASVFLGRFSSKWGTTAIALFMAGASFLTYARAALVAASLAVIWVLVWAACFRVHATGRRNIARFAAVLIVSVVVFLSTVGTVDLERRWADISDGTKAGSGRATFWRVALSSFTAAEWSEQIAGHGYDGMLNLMEEGYGLRIHAHDDLLDLLLIGGVLGILTLASVSAAFLHCIIPLPRASLAFCLGSAILIVLLCQGLLTGQLFGPDVMLAYAIGVTAISGTMHKRPTAGTRLTRPLVHR